MGTKPSKPRNGRQPSSLAVEDDERHGDEVDAYIDRNRAALNESIRKSRKEIAVGKVSKKSIDDIVTEGRRRHSRDS
jgi:hypothetical protein